MPLLWISFASMDTPPILSPARPISRIPPRPSGTAKSPVSYQPSSCSAITTTLPVSRPTVATHTPPLRTNSSPGRSRLISPSDRRSSSTDSTGLPSLWAAQSGGSSLRVIVATPVSVIAQLVCSGLPNVVRHCFGQWCRDSRGARGDRAQGRKDLWTLPLPDCCDQVIDVDRCGYHQSGGAALGHHLQSPWPRPGVEQDDGGAGLQRCSGRHLRRHVHEGVRGEQHVRGLDIHYLAHGDGGGE